VARSRFYPPNNVTAGEWHYLSRRYSKDEAEERRDRLILTLKRLVRKGHDPERLHRALAVGIRHWADHAKQQIDRVRDRQVNAKIARARDDVDRAIASLRKLVPPGGPSLDDDELFLLRDLWLSPVTATPPASPRGGRPWAGKREAEDALHECGVVRSDIRDLIAALGLLDDE
jgi:hypothetical protein